MIVTFILTLSISLQFVAAGMAFRLIPLTGRRLAWGLISVALTLMALRRCIPLIRVLSGDTTIRPDLSAELMALMISLLMVVGISRIAPIFIDRQQAEEKLNEKNKFMESMIQSSAVATFVVNAEHKVIYWNRACEDLTGIKSEGILGTRDHWKAFYDHPRPCVADIIIENKFNEMTNLYKIYTRSLFIPDGMSAESWYPNLSGKNRYIVFDAAPIRDDNGKIIAAIETIQDITERKQAEQELKKRESLLQKIFDILPVGLWFADKNGKLLRGNPAGLKIWGAEPKVGPSEYGVFKARSLPSGREIAPEDWALARTVREGVTIVDEMLEIDAFDGKKKVVLNYTAPVLDDQGAIQGAIVVNLDITQRKEAEEQLQQSLDSLRKAFGSIIQVMASAVQSRDPYTAGHQTRSADLARAIATEMGLPQEDIDGIRMAGTIHDIGKLSIPAEILSKPTKLSDIEFLLIKEHAEKGYEILKEVESPWPLAEIVYQHHERMDGSGYPRHLKGEEILMEARILAVADVVESMASHRPYRPSLGINAALDEIENNKGTLYDADAVYACRRLFREKGFQFKKTKL